MQAGGQLRHLVAPCHLNTLRQVAAGNTTDMLDALFQRTQQNVMDTAPHQRDGGDGDQQNNQQHPDSLVISALVLLGTRRQQGIGIFQPVVIGRFKTVLETGSRLVDKPFEVTFGQHVAQLNQRVMQDLIVLAHGLDVRQRHGIRR